MIESFNFEYKQTKMFQDIQPAGLSVYGERGVEGKNGLSGSTVYFINYSTISDDLKSTLLTRINDSIDLNGSDDTRIYHHNDLIICEISESVYNYIYRIIKTGNESKPYDIERLGYLESETNVLNIFDYIHSVKLNRGEYTTTECHVPVNRSYEYSTANNLSYVNGVNVEDASTRAGTCAERAAIFSAISDGVKKNEFKEINIMVNSNEISTPCFVCRQMLVELFDQDATVRCYSNTGEFREFTVKELTPYPFGPEDLN